LPIIRSFADSGCDGIGDLKGITNKLDSYLNDGKPETDHDLEAGILWLMPIFPADSYHGYNVQNYEAVSSYFGTLDDLKVSWFSVKWNFDRWALASERASCRC
jgi:glycosidase